jgi:hypothetical protein
MEKVYILGFPVVSVISKNIQMWHFFLNFVHIFFIPMKSNHEHGVQSDGQDLMESEEN